MRPRSDDELLEIRNDPEPARREHAGLREQRPDRAVLLVDQRRHQVQRLDELVIASDGERLRILPTENGPDGFFAAVLRRKVPAPTS